MSVFESEDYRTAIKEALIEKKKMSPRFTFQKMAEHCRIQKTYLSRVMNGSGHLSDDQLYLACDYVGLQNEERHFIELLFQFEKSQVDSRRAEIQKEIDRLRQNNSKTESQIKSTQMEVSDSMQSQYFLNPWHQLIHMMITIKKFSNNISAIANALQMPETVIQESLNLLQKEGLISFKNGVYLNARDNLHLPSSSPLISSYRSMMRLRALDKMERIPKEDLYSFSAFFAANLETRNKIKTGFLQYLKSVQKSVHISPETEVFQINFDLLKWT